MGSTTNNNLKIVCWNSRGFAGAVPYLRKLIRDNDIIAVAEHWLHENKLSKLGEISNEVLFCARSSKFSTAENYGTKRGQGGVALFWKKSLGGVLEMTKIIHDRICGIRLQLDSGGVINFFSVYLPAQGCGEDLEVSLDDLAEIIETRDQNDINVILGDFNADIGSNGGTRGVDPATKQGRILCKFMQEYNLIASHMEQTAKGPLSTFVGPNGQSTIDFIMVSAVYSTLVIDCYVGEDEILNTSDHRPVHAELKVCSVKNNTVNRVYKGVKRWDKMGIDERKCKYEVPLSVGLEKVIDTLKRDDITPAALDGCIDAVVAEMDMAARAVPTVKFKKHLKPFWNEDMDTLKAIKISKYKAWVNSGRHRGKECFAYVEYKESKKAFTSELKRLDKLYENEQVMQAVKASEVDRGQFWRLVKRNRKKPGNKTTAIKDKTGKAISDVEGILGIWKEHFQTLSTPKDNDSYDHAHAERVSKLVANWNKENDSGSFLDTKFTLDEVRKAIGKLHKRKACGFDGITAAGDRVLCLGET